MINSKMNNSQLTIYHSPLKKVPQIRFKGFDGGWHAKTIHELINEGAILPPQDGNHGEIHPKAADYVTQGIPFIMAKNIRDGELELYDCSHITREQAESLKKGFAKTGDVLLTHKGTVGETAVVCESKFPFIMLTPQVTYYRVADREKLDNRFLAVSFNTGNFQHALKEVSGGGTRAYIGITQQKNLRITLPPERSEQTKISGYFRELNRLIGLHQRKQDKLVTLKKAMLQKMFPQPGATTPEIRFKGFSGDWVEKKLHSLADRYDNLRIPVSASNRIPGNTPYYGANGIQGYVHSYTHDGEFILVAEDGANDLKNYPVQYVSGKIWVNNHAHVLQGKVGLAETRFLKYAFTQINVEAFLVGGGRSKLNAETMMQLELCSPVDIEEQQKIGHYFRTLDELISKHAIQLQKLKQIKSACLEKMFV